MGNDNITKETNVFKAGRTAPSNKTEEIRELKN